MYHRTFSWIPQTGIVAAVLVAWFWLLVGQPNCFADDVHAIDPQTRDRLYLSEFYTQELDDDGILILASSKPSPGALIEARYLISNMLAGAPKLHKAMAEAGARVTVMAATEFTTDVPEHSQLTPKNYWDRRARGLGGTVDIPVTSCAEENLLNYPGDPYAGENILVHEFAHAVHLLGMSRLDPTFNARLQETYEAAMKKDLWKGTYAASNHEEYFAEGTQSWFNCNAPPNKSHGNIRTRDALQEYDPPLAALMTDVYGANPWTYTLPKDRAAAESTDVKPDDPSRRFAWPASLKSLPEAPAKKSE